MSFADDLLEQARHLANRERRRPKQASLRRAVSTAYYSIFHRLIAASTAQWKIPSQRATLARLFEHRKMKTASLRRQADCEGLHRTGMATEETEHLRFVAEVFVATQQHRHAADYDHIRRWTRTEVVILIQEVEQASRRWRLIDGQPVVQDYLLALLGLPRGVE